MRAISNGRSFEVGRDDWQILTWRFWSGKLAHGATDPNIHARILSSSEICDVLFFEKHHTRID
jgi:hypothetical protein